MTLIEHIRELRTRLFKACLAILVGAIVGYFVAEQVQDVHHRAVLRLHPAPATRDAGCCRFNLSSPLDQFMLNLKIALYVGLILAAPIWLYQLWAFIAPGPAQARAPLRLRVRGRRHAAVRRPGSRSASSWSSRSMPFFLGISAGLHRHRQPRRATSTSSPA